MSNTQQISPFDRVLTRLDTRQQTSEQDLGQALAAAIDLGNYLSRFRTTIGTNNPITTEDRLELLRSTYTRSKGIDSNKANQELLNIGATYLPKDQQEYLQSTF